MRLQHKNARTTFPTVLGMSTTDQPLATEDAPSTPARPTGRRNIMVEFPSSQAPLPATTNGPSIATDTVTSPTSETPQDPTARLQAQLFLMQQQLNLLQSQQPAAQPAIQPLPGHYSTHQSREYWARPIDSSVKFPGETASTSAKRAYKQRLNSYLTKSAPIWKVASGVDPCPIAVDADAITFLKTIRGQDWNFSVKHAQATLKFLKTCSHPAHDRVFSAMHAGSDTVVGSWHQRNSALYSTICDTLDLSADGKDLNILEVVEENNGAALYELIYFRLREVKTSDPMARAMKLKMGLQHIKYEPKPNGVALYFAAIKSHRLKLANLPKPKLIEDWEVVAKALQELPPLHEKFEEVRRTLKLERKFEKVETTLHHCIDSFVNAESDNEIWKDLKPPAKKKPLGSKRKLQVNFSQTRDKRNAAGDHTDKRNSFEKGSCVHHPESRSHVSKTCMNPFGVGSAFGRAANYNQKCAAVRKSVAAGWSPKASWVKVPTGFEQPNPTQLERSTHVNQTTLSQRQTQPQPAVISSADISAYQRVVSALALNRSQLPLPSHNVAPTPTAPAVRAMQVSAPPAHNPTAQLFRTHHGALFDPASMTYSSPHRIDFRQPAHVPPPSLVQVNAARAPTNIIPPPTEQDIIAAGVRYYQNQVGRQDFH